MVILLGANAGAQWREMTAIKKRVPVTPGKNDLEVTCGNCAHMVVVIGEYPWLGLHTSLVYQRLPLLSINTLEKQHRRRDCSCWLLVSEVSAYL